MPPDQGPGPQPGPLLAVRDLTVSFRTEHGELRAVDGVSLTVRRGETLGVVGESGSGKTVTMLALLGLIRNAGAFATGTALFKGKDLLALPERELRAIRGGQIAMVFQDPTAALNPVYSVGFQIAEQILAHEDMSRKAARGQAVRLLESVGIPDAAERAGNYPHQFSGGMRQRVAIAMALSCNPDLVIADEPTTALDVTIQAQILKLLVDLRRRFDTTVVLITHNMGVVAQIADRIVVMYAGRIVEEGTAAAVFADPQHPYTWGLLRSVPRLDQPRIARLTAIPGAQPSPFAMPQGCAFAPRCPHRFEPCGIAPPLEDRDSSGHFVACHLPARQAADLRRGSP